MKYILDKNALTGALVKNLDRRSDLCITEDVLDEGGFNDQEIAKMKNAGIQILRIGKEHAEKLSEVLAAHGYNLKLINLYTNKGTADVVMIAHVIAERDNSQVLFPEEYTIITNDKELIDTAKVYGIKCLDQIPQL